MLHPEKTRASGLAAAITAGGRSRRFGQDKALYPVGGVPLLHRVASSLEDCEPRLLIAPAGRYTLDGWEPYPDLRPGEGPLAGLETALSVLERRRPLGAWLAFAAVDLPHLSSGYWTLLEGRVTDAAQAVIGHDASGRPQPLAALYHTSARPQVTALLSAGERRMRGLLGLLRTEALSWDEIGVIVPEVYENLNTPPDARPEQ